MEKIHNTMAVLEVNAKGELTLEGMIDELCEYAECAGFANFYERKVKGLSKEEIQKLYREIFQK